MTTSTSCSPSRSSLSCCQIDHSSHDDVHEVAIAAKDSYILQEKHSFPKRPEIDLTFHDIRYTVKEWSLRNIKPSECNLGYWFASWSLTGLVSEITCVSIRILFQSLLPTLFSRNRNPAVFGGAVQEVTSANTWLITGLELNSSANMNDKSQVSVAEWMTLSGFKTGSWIFMGDLLRGRCTVAVDDIFIRSVCMKSLSTFGGLN